MRQDLYGNVKIQNYFVLDYYKQYSQVKLHSPSKRASVTTNPLLWYSRNISSSAQQRDIVSISSCKHTASLVYSLHNNVIGMRGNFSSHLFWSFKHPADSSHINATLRTSDCLWLHKTYSNWFQLQNAYNELFFCKIYRDGWEDGWTTQEKCW